jgi:ankyrin repeat protein
MSRDFTFQYLVLFLFLFFLFFIIFFFKGEKIKKIKTNKNDSIKSLETNDENIQDETGKTICHYGKKKKKKICINLNFIKIKIIQAVLKNNIPFVDKLIERNCNFNVLDNENKTAFHYSLELRNFEIAKKLIKMKNFNFFHEFGNRIDQVMNDNLCPKEIKEELERYYKSISLEYSSEFQKLTILCDSLGNNFCSKESFLVPIYNKICSGSGSVESLEVLMNYGLEIHLNKKYEGNYPIIKAFFIERQDIVLYLLSKGKK